MKELTQSKIETFIETSLNIGSGFILSLLTWIYIVPLTGIMEIESKMYQGLALTSLFTVVSLARTYIWRRIFNHRLKKRVHSFLEGHKDKAKLEQLQREHPNECFCEERNYDKDLIVESDVYIEVSYPLTYPKTELEGPYNKRKCSKCNKIYTDNPIVLCG